MGKEEEKRRGHGEEEEEGESRQGVMRRGLGRERRR